MPVGDAPAGLEKAREEPVNDVDSFVFFGTWLASPESSNVAGAMYEAAEQRLTVEFKNGNFYAYYPVSAVEATDFAMAGSKGAWIWDHCRVRGTKCDHQKDYVFLSALSRAGRKRPC
jgi:hypothetical protein